jgi:DNA repair protein RecN (Recombination protein N)
LVFDEIDVGISGRIAQKVGQVLKSLASSHQIIAITHLPQIAAFADQHYSVQKGADSERVISWIKKLEDDDVITEIAKLLGGEKITENNLNNARELVQLSNI